ncbi:MAG: hypothetical protein CVU05_11450 [Bacteroidetes bacterium HGW-Bacteroidetes-21]|jgi:hypothetical protein|nr:MAG: hypothetical protein CVU05_11450 [Bacteroidetes bacterium HGW-Bacteroidetes-21]
MKNLIVLTTLICALIFTKSQIVYAQDPLGPARTNWSSAKIQVAILLDASNSMDGLIDQAKSRLWNIVNTLTTLKYEGKTPEIEIALYMYGNDGLEVQNNYIRQITPFTSDLDLISEKLFAIRTNGGYEYCGAVIDHAVKNLKWGNEKSNMKLVYIAGNEPFTQGSISYKEAIADAVKKDIYINTIHCGDYLTGVNESWKDGADKGQGKYFCINSNEKVIYVVTPYDDQIYKCNERLNKTYIYYGSYGYSSYTNQSVQDQNAQSISGANYTERTVSKSKAIYNNEKWDLVDKVEADSTYYKNVDKKTLPKELQNLSTEQLKTEIDKKNNEREVIQKEIAELSKKRQAYIDNETKNSKTQDDFGNAVNSSILEVAKTKGYKLSEN